MTLNEKIIAYLIVNNISYGVGDYQTGQPEGEADQVLHWNTEKLGVQPTQDQLNSAWATNQANISAKQQAEATTKASAIAKLTALGLTADEIKVIIGS